MNDADEFFRRFGDYVVRLRFYENEQSVTVEELYQAFAERLTEELHTDPA